MKKIFLPFALLLLVAVGCKHKDPNLVEAELYTLSDSLYMENEYEDGYSYYTANLDVPITENDSLRLSILHWILSDTIEDYEEYLQNDKNRFFEEEGNEPGSHLESNYSLMEQTDYYVTYVAEGFVYTGGAHSIPWYYGASFSKIDGSIVGYDMFADPEQLVEILKTHLQDQHLENYDLIEEMEETSPETNLILPVNEPWIETDSIVFCYQAFEIAPYGSGNPLCKISKDELWPYMSEKGKSLFTKPQQ